MSKAQKNAAAVELGKLGGSKRLPRLTKAQRQALSRLGHEAKAAKAKAKEEK